MENQIPEEVIKEVRFDRLLKEVQEISQKSAGGTFTLSRRY